MQKVTRSARILCAAGAAMSVWSVSANAQTNASWNAAVNGNWSDPTKWSTNPFFPNNGNGGQTYNATLAATGAAHLVTLDVPITIESFTLSTADAELVVQNSNLTMNRDYTQSAGVIQAMGGTGQFLVRGTTTLQGAVFEGLSRFDADGDLVFSGNTDSELCDTDIGHNGNNCTWSGNNNLLLYSMNTSSRLTFGPNSTLTISNNQQILWNNVGTRSTLTNQGTILKTTGIGITDFVGVTFANTGTLDVRTGTLKSDGVGLTSGATTGTWKVSGGASIDLRDTVTPANPLNITTNRAKVTIDGVGSTFDAIRTVTLNDTAGEMTVSGGNTFTTAGAYRNTGKLTVGTGSTFQLTGAFGNNVGGDVQGGTFVIAGTLKLDAASITRLTSSVTLSGAGQLQDSGGLNALRTLTRVSTTGKFALTNTATFTAASSIKFEGTNSAELNIEAGSEFIVPGGFTLDNYDSGLKKLSEGDFKVQGILRFENNGVENLDSKLTLDGGSAQVLDAANTPALAPLKMVDTNGSFSLAGSANFTANVPNTGGFVFTVAATGKVNIANGSQFDINGDLANYSGGTFTDGEFNVDGRLRARNIADVTTVSSRISLSSATGLITNFTNADVFEAVNTITGTGLLTVSNGRDLHLTSGTGVGVAGGLTVGPNGMSDATSVNVDQDVRLTAPSAELTVTGGATLSIGHSNVSGNENRSLAVGSGRATVQTGGTLNTVRDVLVEGNNGRLNAQSGGHVNVGGNLQVSGTGASVNVNAATAAVTGAVNHSAGTVTADHSFVSAGAYNLGGSGSPTLNLLDSTLAVAANFVQNSGELHLSNGVLNTGGDYIMNGGLLTGNGFINGDVVTNGMIGPGNSPGRISISGSLVMMEAARIVLEIGGATPGMSGYDQLIVGGDLTASSGAPGHKVGIELINGFMPRVGDVFALLVCDRTNLTMADFDLPALPNGMYWDRAAYDTGFYLMVTQVPAPGAAVVLTCGVLFASRRRRGA